MYLLDTNILIWVLANNQNRIGKKLFALIVEPSNLIFVSVVSYWEIIIKQNLGKLEVPNDLPKQINAAGFEWLNVNLEDIEAFKHLPDLHKDPFDRLLIAQSIANDLTLITADEFIIQYSLKFLKA